MARFNTLILAFLLVALAFFGTVARAQDPAAADPAAADPAAADPAAADPGADAAPGEGTSDSTDPAADGTGVEGDTAADPAASPSPADPAASPAATGSTAPGNPDGPGLDVSEPYDATSVQPGGNLTAMWNLDTTGTWNPMTIELMSGSNLVMKSLQTVGTNIDATTVGQYSFQVPDVTPYSKIYFLQFTTPNGAPSWSTRFTIAGPDGSTTPPANTEMVDGVSVGWGDGALANGAAAGSGGIVGPMAPTSSQGARPTGVGGTGITLYTDKITQTGIPMDVSTHGVAAATIGASTPGENAAASLRPAVALVGVIAAAALLI